MDRKKKAEHTRNRERPCLGIATPRRATAKANGITPWPPRHAQSAMMSHIYALTCVNVLEPHCRQPPSVAARSAVTSRIIAHERKRMPLGNRRFSPAISCFRRNRVAGKGSVRKYDAHQGVPAEMSYFLCRLLRRTGPREAAPYQQLFDSRQLGQ
jgi:hypothetical protein